MPSHTRTDKPDTPSIRGHPGGCTCASMRPCRTKWTVASVSPVRNRYLDMLRAAAIVRVIVYHLFGWPWLSILLPAMGIMFALAGSLTAASLDRRAAGRVITSRLRRLLPPLWLLGLIAVPIMIYLGWPGEEDGDHPFSWARLAFWILPVGDPPGSDRAMDLWDPLWYVRAYLWFVVLSPLMYLVYRRIGWFAVAAPMVAIAVLDVTGFTLPDTADAAMWDFVTYGACWIAGFAHHDGRLARTRPVVLAGVARGARRGRAVLADRPARRGRVRPQRDRRVAGPVVARRCAAGAALAAADDLAGPRSGRWTRR